MSVDCDGGSHPSVWREKFRRARKEHDCEACGRRIERGEMYSYTFSVYDGNPSETVRCLRCDVLYQLLQEKIGRATDGDECADPNLNCGHTWQQRWEEDPPPEVAMLAFYTPAEVAAMFPTQEAIEEFASGVLRRWG